MRLRAWIESPRTRLDFTAGFIDGILTALTLTAGRLLRTGAPSLGLALRVAAATGLTTLFVFFVAHYAELRAEIAHAERELNLLAHGKLAEGALGRQATRKALAGALLAAFCGLTGAFAPLVLSYLLPTPVWLGVVLSVGLLGVLGAVLARSFYGGGIFWSAILMLGGALLTWIGTQLDITG
jgi:VIT1/CCC1 family predicted Fe2+/Mn2+ transporter